MLAKKQKNGNWNEHKGVQKAEPGQNNILKVLKDVFLMAEKVKYQKNRKS